MKVFVIDDNELHLKMCRILLQNLGHDVFVCDSLGKLKSEIGSFPEPDVALIDYRLNPGETGLDVLDFLKESRQWMSARFIAVTADVSERALLERSGFDKVVFKPITEGLLKEIIH